ncbi:MAG: hypothetical protein LBV67_08410 [Streptococcaceae bacterium]|jgi:hypothetical protein|nr:hypothetical protein [Streptococcaceae bacterium]
MIKYRVVDVKSDFQITALGVELGEFNDFIGNAKKVAARLAEIEGNGDLAGLMKLRERDINFVVNYVINGKPWRGFGVLGSFNYKDAQILDFLKGNYIVAYLTNNNKEKIVDELTNEVFNNLLPTITDYNYVGPGNSSFILDNGDGTYTAEMWLRAAKR